MSTLSKCVFHRDSGAVHLSWLSIKIFLCSFLLLLMPIIGNAQSTLTLNWNANTESQLAGYKVYYGSASRKYDYNKDVGNQTTYSLAPLSEDQTTYFAVTAYDNNGLESGFSDEVSWTAGLSDRPNILPILLYLLLDD